MNNSNKKRNFSITTKSEKKMNIFAISIDKAIIIFSQVYFGEIIETIN